MNKLLFLLLLASLPANSEIYKCKVNGKTIFSDTPCGDSAVVVDVKEATKPTGTQFSDPDMQSLGNKMGKERRLEELTRAISKQQKHIEKLHVNYNNQRTRLENDLARHRERKDSSTWRNHAYKREKYYEKERTLRNKINQIYREYKADREQAYNKLSSLKEQRRRIR